MVASTSVSRLLLAPRACLRGVADGDNPRAEGACREKYFWAYEKHLDQIEQLALRKEIRDYRNMGHESHAIIGSKWDGEGRFLHHFLPTISGHQPREDVEMNTRLQEYLSLVRMSGWSSRRVISRRSSPRDFRFPVAVPYLFGGELPKELKGGPQLEVSVESYNREITESEDSHNAA